MAATGDENIVAPEPAVSHLDQLKSDLQGYRELLIPLNKILEWDQSYYPAVLVALITFAFAIIWYLEPSVLTTFSVLGIIMCAVDFVVPMVTPYIFNSSQWTSVQEHQYENICIRLCNARTHIHNLRVFLAQLKNDKPKMYLLVMMGAFALLAWIGSLIDNLLLTYLMVVFVVMLPGLRKHGILQRVTGTLVATCKNFLNKQGLKAKKK